MQDVLCYNFYMAYKLLKPKNTDYWQATWDTIKIQKFFWIFFVFAIFFFIIFQFFLSREIFLPGISSVPIAIILIYIFLLLYKKEKDFWKEIAEINGWKYKEKIQSTNFNLDFFKNILNYTNKTFNIDGPLLFKEGHSKRVSNEIEGIVNNRNFRFLNYKFTTGYGKKAVDHTYTIFIFKFNGSFPHIYLNNKNNSWSKNTGEYIPLHSLFEEKFYLLAPKKYEIEALEIFTFDILDKLLNNNYSYDIEFINQEMFVFIDEQIRKFEQFEKMFNEVLELEDLLDEKLDNFKFEKIGDMPSVLG